MKKTTAATKCLSFLYVYLFFNTICICALAQGAGFSLRIISQFSTSQIGSNGFAQLTRSAQVAANGQFGFVGNKTIMLKAGLCVEGNESTSYICQCRDVIFANIMHRTSTSAQANSTSTSNEDNTTEKRYSACDVNQGPNVNGGAAYSIINSTLAEFRDLQTSVAGSKIRIFMWGNIGDSTVIDFSNLFVVNPGEFQSLRILDEPTNVKGCPRCPAGTFLAGSPVQATVALQDRGNNTIAFLCVNTTFCLDDDATRRSVVVEFPQRRNFIAAVRVTSVQGIAFFPNLTVISSDNDVRLRFTATLVGSFGTITSVVSQSFIVTNSAPFRPRVIHPIGPIVCANGSLILPQNQPQVEIVDVFNNRVVSDCYDNASPGCSGSVPGTCNANFSACNPKVSAQLVSLSAFLIGLTTSNRASAGLAIFTDLGVVSRNRSCGSSTMFIRFSIQNVPGTDDKMLILAPGAATLNIIHQPPVVVVSDEPFSTPVEVQVLDCAGNRAIYVVAQAVCSVNNEQIPGLLRGQTIEPVRDGVFVFSNLNIYNPAIQLSLRFNYISYSSIAPAISSTFDVYAPPTALKILRQPSAEDPSQPTTAGRVFWLQPQVQLQPALPTTRFAVAIIVPGWDPGSLQWHDPGNFNSLSGNFRAEFDVQGIARFTDLSVRKASMYQGLQNQNYRIRFSSNTLQIDSFTFQIFPAEWAGLFVPNSKQPIASVAASLLLIQPAVCLVDRFLNLIQQLEPISITAILLGGPPDAILLVCSNSATCDPTCAGVVCNFGTITQAAVNAAAQFQNLAITQAFDSYQFFFSTTSFNVTSKTFAILPGNIVSLAVSNISSVSSADGPLQVQPILTVLDRKGNTVDMPKDSLIYYDLRTMNGNAVVPGVPAKDALLWSMCPTEADPGTGFSSMATVIENSTALFSKSAARFTNLTVHRAMRGFFLQFTLISASRVFVANTTSFSIIPGAAVGICAISLPSLCAVLAPCHQKARIVCVDAFGNVQPSCKRCADTICDISTFINTSVPQHRICPSNQVCVELYSGPTDAALSKFGTGVYNMINCDKQTCSEVFLSSQEGLSDVPTQQILINGGASFTDLVMNVSSLNYRLRFYVFTTNPYTLAVEEWSFVTPDVTVHPPPPIVKDVVFSSSMNQLRVLFDESTTMNINLVTQDSYKQQDTSCSTHLNASFVDSIGLNPICTWPTPDELLISLGYGAYVNTSTRFFLSSNSKILAKPIGDPPYSELLRLQDVLLPSTTEEGAILAGIKIGKYFPKLPVVVPAPNPKIVMKDSLAACDRFEADARLSSGDAKRPFKNINWGLNFTASRFKNGILQSGRQTRMFKTRIQFSSMLPGDMNFVGVSLMFNAPVLPGTMFIISGLPGYVKPLQTNASIPVLDATPVPCLGSAGRCVSIPIQGPGAALFAKTQAQWNMETADLLFQVNRSLFLPALEDIIFSFSMQNPSTFIPASTITISSKRGNNTGICLDPESVTCFRNIWYTFPAQPMEMNCGRLCASSAIFQIVDKQVSLISGQISEYSQANGMMNELTLKISPSHDLSPGALVILGGLQEVNFASKLICVKGPDAFRFGCLPCSQNSLPSCPGFNHLSAIGSFDSLSGEISLVVKAGQKLAGGTIYEISFNAINPAQLNRAFCSANTVVSIDQVACPSLTKVNIQFRVSSQSRLPTQRFLLSGDVLGGGVYPRIIRAGIRESNSFSGLSNVLHVEFITNIDLPSQTVITLSGIRGLDVNQELLLYFNTGGCVARTSGRLTQISYSNYLFFTVTIPDNCNVTANNITSFDVKLKNAASLISDQQILSLSASFSGCAGCIQGCGCEMTSLGSFLLQSHTIENGLVLGSGTSLTASAKLEAVETAVIGQRNVLTISFQFSASLKEQSNVTVTGLNGMLSSFVNVMVSNGSQYRISAIVGAESIWFSTPWSINFGGTFVFKIFLENDARVQNWSRINASVDAAVVVCDGALFDFCQWFKGNETLKPEIVRIPNIPISIGIPIPVGKPALYSTSIRGLTQVPGAWNILTASFVSNFVIEGPGMLNITGKGLDKFLLPPSASTFSLKSDLASLLPNCTCNGALENVPVDCSGCTVGDQAFSVWQPDGLFGDPRLKIARGYWGNGILSISLQRGASVPVGKVVYFSFLVLNPSFILDVDFNMSLQSFPNFQVPSQVIENNLVQQVGFESARFVSFSVQQSSTVAGDVNLITVQFSVNFPLVSFSSIAITISGFQGFQTRTGYIPLTGRHAFNVAKKAAGNWSREQGRIVLLSGSIMNRCPVDGTLSSCPTSARSDSSSSGLIQFEFSFNLQNPSALNNGGYPIQISARTREVNIPLQGIGFSLLQTPVLGAMTLNPIFNFANITESRRIQAVTNQILVQFSTSVAMFPMSSITITGFENTLSPNGQLSLIGPNSSVFVSAVLSSGTVVFTVANLIRPLTIIEFGFTLINARNVQMGKKPTISGFATVKSVCENRPVTDCARFVSSYLEPTVYSQGVIFLQRRIIDANDFFSASIVPSFIFKSINESTKVNFATNKVTVVLVPNVLIPVGSEITISGLFPSSSWKVRDSLLAVFGPSASAFGGFGQLISCNDISTQPVGFDSEVMCQLDNNERKLALVLKSPLLPGINTSFAFKLPNGHNLCCSSSCDANCQSFYTSIAVTGRNSDSEKNLYIASSDFETRIFYAGGNLSWVVKHVHESSGVANAMNKLTFTIRPNAPLYPGTQILISGLNLTEQKSCMKCFPEGNFGDMIPGLGCSDSTRSRCRSQVLCDTNSGFGDPEDPRCTPKFQANPEFQNMVYYPCLPIFNNDMTENIVFAVPTSFRKGVLNATIDIGQKIPEDEDTKLVIWLRNSQKRQLYGAEHQCLAGDTPGVDCGRTQLPGISGGRSLMEGISIVTSSARLCDSNQNADTVEGCNDGDWSCSFINGIKVCTSLYAQGVSDIGGNSQAVDGQNQILRDSCPTCVRQSDMIDFDSSLQEINTLMIRDLPSGMRSRQVLPSLIEGGLTGGSYTIYLQLSNWIGSMKTLERMFFQIDRDDPSTFESEGLGGSLGDEVVVPTSLIESTKAISVYSDQSVLLDCNGMLASCLNITEAQNLLFSWQKENETNVLSKQSTFLVPKNFLFANQVQGFTCQVRQGSLLGPKSTVWVAAKLRNLEVHITGIADGGQVWNKKPILVDAGFLTFDPERLTTGLTNPQTGFDYEWQCFKRSIHTDKDVPCSLANNSGDVITFDSTTFQEGDKVKLSVEAIRAEGRFVGTGKARRVVTVTIQSKETVNILAIQCDPNVGFSLQCRPLTGNYSSSNDPIVLEAVLPASVVSSGQTITSYNWSIPDPYDGFLSPALTLSSLSQSVLIIKPGALTPGRPIKFRVSVRDNFEFSGTAEVSIFIRLPPFGGTISVFPLNGSSLMTTYNLMAIDWTADNDSLPLSFRFSAAYPLETVVSKSMSVSSSVYLPQGDITNDFLQLVILDVLDCFGGISRSSTPVAVLPFLSPSAAMLQNVFDKIYRPFLTIGNGFQALSLIQSVAREMNTVNISCKRSAGTAYVNCNAVDECCQRTVFRSFLLQRLKETSDSLPISLESVQNQASILAALTFRQGETDMNFIRACTEVLTGSISAAMTLANADVTDLTTIYAEVLDQLFTSLASEEVASQGRDASLHLQRSLNAPDLNTRNLVWSLVQAISMISSLAVKDSKPAQNPYIFSSASMVVYTNRIFGSQASQDLDIELNGTSLRAKVPKSFFATISSTLAVDIMLAISYLSSDLLPESLGPFIVLQARVGIPGSNFNLYTPPEGWGTIEITLPFDSSVGDLNEFEAVDKRSGSKRILYGKVFDYGSWTWMTDQGIRRLPGGQGSTITIQSDVFGYFSATSSFQGCDGIDLSMSVLDACGVCGGDNSTCSGCDGIPGTGRSKNCSGHGSCSALTRVCSCSTPWFGVMCEVLCRDAIHCSGHGLCLGTRCTCEQGYESANISYPGPFCDRVTKSTQPGGPTSQGPQSDDQAKSTLIVIVVPALGGSLLLCIVIGFIYTRKAKKITKYRQNILEFPQPQLAIPAEKRQHEIIMIPDETGWSNVEYVSGKLNPVDDQKWKPKNFDQSLGEDGRRIKTSAAFSYGPNSGQLVSAIAASTRASVCEMSTDVIERRVRNMQNQIRSRQTVSKYKDLGPVEPSRRDEQSGSDDDDLHHQDSEFVGRIMMLDQVTSNPEWLIPRVDMPPSRQ